MFVTVLCDVGPQGGTKPVPCHRKADGDRPSTLYYTQITLAEVLNEGSRMISVVFKCIEKKIWKENTEMLRRNLIGKKDHGQFCPIPLCLSILRFFFIIVMFIAKNKMCFY